MTIVEPDLAWVMKNLKTDMDSHPTDHLDNPAGVLIITAVHLSAFDRGYIKSHSASLDDPFNPSQFQKCHLSSRIISNTQLK
ncbi:hypothetical protein YC2023_050653 [Brassica napus]